MFSYNLPRGWYLTSQPTITADWTQTARDRWLLLVSGGADVQPREAGDRFKPCRLLEHRSSGESVLTESAVHIYLFEALEDCKSVMRQRSVLLDESLLKLHAFQHRFKGLLEVVEL